VKYYKNTELAKIYSVSEKSIRNWAQAAGEGRIDLQLHQENGKTLIANTAKNTSIIEDLVAKGKKYKNTRGYKVVEPTPHFYELYSPKQVIDIISNLDIYRETPLQYTYFNSGAKRWDKYTQNLLKQKTSNSLVNTIQLFELNMSYIDKLLEGCTSVNIIDIGVGNALPMRSILEHFHSKGLVRRYIGLDVSKELLEIAEHNIAEWFDNEINFEGHIRDINYDRFDDLLAKDAFAPNADTSVNLVFFLGGTISNFRAPYRVLSTIHDSMGKRDLLFATKKLDTEKSRRYFEMAVSGNQEIDLVIKLLNIDPSLYSLEQQFNQELMEREVVVKLKVAIAIKFQLNGQERVLEFNKGESILLWRARHQNFVQAIEEFDSNGFDLLNASRSTDQEYCLVTSRIKTINS
jgi:uncharacterized SAM-dependent methyltransferase